MGVSDLNRAFNGKYDLLYFERWKPKDRDKRQGKRPVRDRLEAHEALEAWKNAPDKWELWKYSDPTEREYSAITDIEDARAVDISLLFALSREGKTCFVIRNESGNYITVGGESAELNEARPYYSEAEARDIIQGFSRPEAFRIVQALLSTDGKLQEMGMWLAKPSTPHKDNLPEMRMRIPKSSTPRKGVFSYIRSIKNIVFVACCKLRRW